MLELGFVWGINAIEFVNNSLVWKRKLKKQKQKKKAEYIVRTLY